MKLDSEGRRRYCACDRGQRISRDEVWAKVQDLIREPNLRPKDFCEKCGYFRWWFSRPTGEALFRQRVGLPLVSNFESRSNAEGGDEDDT